MNRKSPPIWTSKVASTGPMEGVDPLPNPIGVSMDAVKSAEETSEATPGAMDQSYDQCDCNGSNPKIADLSGFASGKDIRNRSGADPRSNPNPARPGA